MTMRDKTYADTVGGAFRFLADYLDVADEAITFCARHHRGHDLFELGDGVQRDLRQLARFLDDHPEVDSQLLEAMPQFREWTDPGTVGHTEEVQ